jgi:transcription elongation factor GreA
MSLGLGSLSLPWGAMTDDNMISPAGLEALKDEIRRLEEVERPAIADRIRTAREWGDLKENAEYHAAKNDQSFLETRILRLNQRLRSSTVVDGPATTGEVGFGSEVRVRDAESGKELTWTLVGATEADLSAGRLSVESPVARALIGHREGDDVAVQTPRGERGYTILGVS